MKTIIVLSGKSGSGKTTVEKYLEANIAGSVESYQMATKLKNVICALTGCTINQLDDQNFKKGYSNYAINLFNDVRVLTYRELMLHISKKLRFDNNNIFIDDVIRHLANSTSQYIIIPDVRELRELDALIEYANVIGHDIIKIRIDRLQHNKDHKNDKTETDLDNYNQWDFYICNDKDFDHLYNTVEDLCEIANIPLKIDAKQRSLF